MSGNICGACCSNEEIELDVYSSLLAQYFSVDFALTFSTKSSPSDLTEALSKIISSFQATAGRLVRRDDKFYIVCNNSGVAFTHETSSNPAPDFSCPISSDLFDLVRDCVPTGVSMGEALMRIKVTDFETSQVIAISINHGLCDASGIGAFLQAWSAAFTGGCGEVEVRNDRIGASPPIPAYGQPPITSSDEMDDKRWGELRHGAGCVEVEELSLENMVLFSHFHSKQDCDRLKQECKHVAGEDMMLSSNDVITAELVTALGLKGDIVPINLIMNFRGVVQADNVFGNMFTSLEFGVRNSLAAGVDIRKLLPVARSRGFMEWHLGQGANVHWPSKLTVNSWTKAFRLKDIMFNTTPDDIMLGPMLATRAAMMKVAGCCYCICLPTHDEGVKVVGCLAKSVAERLGESVTIVPL